MGMSLRHSLPTGGKTTWHNDTNCSNVSSWSNQEPATCQQQWQNPRIIKCVKHILWLLWNTSKNSLAFLPSSDGPMSLSLEPGQMVHQQNMIKVTPHNFQGKSQKGYIFSCLLSEESLHVLRKLRSHRERANADDSGLPLLRSHLSGNINCSPGSKGGFGWFKAQPLTYP